MQSDEIARISADADWLAQKCRQAGLRSLASTVAGLITAGELPAGAQLPTIRDMASRLELSPVTVTSAWRRLREDGLIETNRRGGTVVLAQQPLASAGLLDASEGVSFDLSHGGPDPRLQPDLEQALLAGLRLSRTGETMRVAALACLIDAVAPTWPFRPEEWTTAGGGVEGMFLALESAASQSGTTVAIEQPTNPRNVEAIRALGLRALPVAWDAEGPSVADLRKAIGQGASVFLYQPRGHQPLGLSVSDARLEALADCLQQHRNVTIVEDDGLGPLSPGRAVSLGSRFPKRILHVRTYCKAYGVDLRVCVAAGAHGLVERFNRARTHGAGVTSRILQGALTHLVSSTAVERRIRSARQHYATRRRLLARALGEFGLTVGEGDGMGLWLPVPDETATLINLSAHGIIAGPGSRCRVDPTGSPHLWLTTSRLPENNRIIQGVAQIVASALSHPW